MSPTSVVVAGQCDPGRSGPAHARGCVAELVIALPRLDLVSTECITVGRIGDRILWRGSAAAN